MQLTHDTPTHRHARADSALKRTRLHTKGIITANTHSNRMNPPENTPACAHQCTHMATRLEHRNTLSHNILAYHSPHVLGFSILLFQCGILLFQYGNPLQGINIWSLQGVVVTDGLLVFGLQEVIILLEFGNIVQAVGAIGLLVKQQVPHLLDTTNRQGVHLPKLVHPEEINRWKLRTIIVHYIFH